MWCKICDVKYVYYCLCTYLPAQHVLVRAGMIRKQAETHTAMRSTQNSIRQHHVLWEREWQTAKRSIQNCQSTRCFSESRNDQQGRPRSTQNSISRHYVLWERKWQTAKRSIQNCQSTRCFSESRNDQQGRPRSTQNSARRRRHLAISSSCAHHSLRSLRFRYPMLIFFNFFL